MQDFTRLTAFYSATMWDENIDEDLVTLVQIVGLQAPSIKQRSV